MPQLERAEFYLEPIAPFRLDLTSWALRRRQSNIIDRFDGNRYSRAIAVGDTVIEASVWSLGKKRPRLKAEIKGMGIGSEEVRSAKKVIELLLGLRIGLDKFYLSVRQDERVWELAKRFRGVKPPRFPSIFETLVNAISCQQVSLTVGLLLLNRLALNYGRTASCQKPSSSLTPFHAFPLPRDISKLMPVDFRKLGFSLQKSKYIIELAKSIVNEEIDLENLSRLSDVEALDYLQTIPGVGLWSSQYVLLRGLGRLHRFPAGDVGAQNGLMRLLGLRKKPDYERTLKLIRPWQPYAGMMYFHLLLNRLEREGVLFPN